MASPMRTSRVHDDPFAPLWVDGLPILYEDEEEGEMGEANLHVLWTQTLHYGLMAHLAYRPELRVYSNMNLYYRDAPLHPKTRSRPYVSPDVMVVEPFTPLPDDLVSYTIGREGPAPLLASEVLSERSAQQRDLKEKLPLYARLGVKEYVQADPVGRFLPQRLVIHRLQTDGSWLTARDPDGGITSDLQFRVILESNNQLRLQNTVTGRLYVRPEEADLRVREMEAELANLKKSRRRKGR
jgi:Uma2 family endonuclease